MIKQQFLYFAQYPDRNGVLAMFTNGTSDFPGYNQLVQELKQLPQQPRIPEIANYVYGQSFDELKQRIDKLLGSFLFVDYGEMDMLGTQPGSFRISQRIAITVAYKMPNRADTAEYMLASDNTLQLIAKLHAWLIADANAGNIDWLSRTELDKAEIIPFVATELTSIGWTLMLSCIAPDPLDTHTLSRSFAKQIP
ncbi:hypothetical protein [Hoylesella marshii]|uniref:Uncharacterized protein n=1 Tax=Hoylesella marshii DSM 16973 = JCM 13450 TaxID=862515 RepID=E0NST9_9BACT|nr:hypothetical protein [Hoylesella marshii]EFM01803.1 hypothetical protein HMPREF0658_1291 [Hoylesella marshii DSM 16973 = JCM 13450]